MARYSSGKHAIAECDQCGFQYKLKALKKLPDSNLYVCDECWEEEHPQEELGKYPVFDPQAVRNPRPDLSYHTGLGSRGIQWGWAPVGGAQMGSSGLTPNDLEATGYVGTVTVTS
jgi:hypothetical protein